MAVMVVMRSPYSGGVVTVSISSVERLVQQGWMVEEPYAPASAAPHGEPTVPENLVSGPTVEPVRDAVGDAPKGNASRAAWRDYAESLGIDVDGMTRAEIRVAVSENGE